MRRLLMAILLTTLLCAIGIYLDGHVNPDAVWWQHVGTVLNLPGLVVSKIVGSGHGFAQLVLPFIVSIVFYVFFFWAVVSIVGSFRKKAMNSTRNE